MTVRQKQLIENYIRSKVRKILKEDKSVKLTLICTSDGRVQTMTGEARSAEILKGDSINVIRENDHFYFGEPIVKNKFQHSPGLSGKTIKNPNDVPKFEVAINKDKVGIDEDPRGFWATFKVKK